MVNMIYLPVVLPEVKTRLFFQEFTLLKGYLEGFCDKPIFDTHSRLRRNQPLKYMHIFKLVELMFVMSPCAFMYGHRTPSETSMVVLDAPAVYKHRAMQHVYAYH